jgi:excisionase family DNA binding protein
MTTTTAAPPAIHPVIQDGLATIPEASLFLNISRAKIYLMMEHDGLRYVKIGRCRRIPWQVLRDLVSESLVS